MSEEAPITPPNLPEAASELDPSQKYQDVLLVARSLEDVSTTSTQEAVEEMRVLEQRLLYAAPDSDGVLVLNRHFHQYHKPEDAIAKGTATYRQTIEKIASHGYLNPETEKAFDYTFSTRPRELDNHHSMLNGDVLDEPVRMFVREGTTEETFVKLAEQFGLDEQALAQLKRVAQSKQRIEDNPREGSNFLYHYSTPFIEVGTAKGGEVKARLGVILTHANDSAGLDQVNFDGVNIPTDMALDMIADGIGPYVEQAKTERVLVSEAPSAEELTREISEKREASAQAFVEQLKKFAPEASSLTDEQLLSIVKTTAVNSYGNGQAYPEGTPTELHLIRVIMDKDASFRINSDENGNVNAKHTPGWAPQHYLVANGRTGIVTRLDYDAAPTVAFSGKEVGRQEFDAEHSAQLRKQMFEAKTRAKAA